jgi:hypothetical protein
MSGTLPMHTQPSSISFWTSPSALPATIITAGTPAAAILLTPASRSAPALAS